MYWFIGKITFACNECSKSGYCINFQCICNVFLFQLMQVLKTVKVEEKELHGFKVSTRALEKLTPQEIRDLKVVFDTFDFQNKGCVLSVIVTIASLCIVFHFPFINVNFFFHFLIHIKFQIKGLALPVCYINTSFSFVFFCAQKNRTHGSEKSTEVPWI